MRPNPLAIAFLAYAVSSTYLKEKGKEPPAWTELPEEQTKAMAEQVQKEADQYDTLVADPEAAVDPIRPPKPENPIEAMAHTLYFTTVEAALQL